MRSMAVWYVYNVHVLYSVHRTADADYPLFKAAIFLSNNKLSKQSNSHLKRQPIAFE